MGFMCGLCGLLVFRLACSVSEGSSGLAYVTLFLSGLIIGVSLVTFLLGFVAENVK